MVKNGKESIELYKEIFGASDMTVNKIKNRVAKAYND